jgi:TFIIF-interacting CTD phosphatase-like protein
MPATYGNHDTRITPPSEPAASEPMDSNLIGFGNELRNDLKQQAKFSERKIKSANSTLTDNNNNNEISKIINPELDISGSGLFENDKSGPSQLFSASTPNHSSNNMCFLTPDTEITGAAVNTFAKICEKVIPKTLNFKT